MVSVVRARASRADAIEVNDTQVREGLHTMLSGGHKYP